MSTASPPRSPSFSPPSSPPLHTLDSSLPTSSEDSTVIVDSPIQLAHPFAASFKANRPPPQYEKKTSFVTPIPSIVFPKNVSSDNINMEDKDPLSFLHPKTPEDLEMEIWDQAITKVVDFGHGAVVLSDQNLSFIPKKIAELANFVAIPEKSELANASRSLAVHASSGGRLFTRVTTAPPSTSLFMPRLFGERTKSIAEASVGLAREHLQLFLSGNQIRYLPRELFHLEKMTVLILRANQLTFLPPEIVRLTGLRELNVSNNKLRYLPSEMLSMTLDRLHLHPNPFLQPPPPWQITPAMLLCNRALSSPTHPLSRVVPLVELCLRVLLSKYHPPYQDHDPSLEDNSALPDPDSTVLAARYPLPLEGWQIPPPLGKILETCVPGSVSSCKKSRSPLDDYELTGIGVCPSPRHGTDKQVFVRHAEERYTWEHEIAGVRVGGTVPVMWRGCQWGCLDFLGVPNTMDILKSEGTKMKDIQEVVQPLKLSSAGFEDFGD